jgi:hypothetical protein
MGSSTRSSLATRVPAQSPPRRVFEKTTFGISFIGRANLLFDVGQTAAILIGDPTHQVRSSGLYRVEYPAFDRLVSTPVVPGV